MLAVSTYIQNDWFQLCAEVYAEFGDTLIFPIMNFLWMDDRKLSTDERFWVGVHKFFETKITELRNLKAEKSQSTIGKNILIGAFLEKVLEMLNRQLSEMDFFKNPDIICEKLKLAPLANLGYESFFLDNLVTVVVSQPSLGYLGKMYC